MTALRTKFVLEIDKADWRELFDGYADFYGVLMNLEKPKTGVQIRVND